MRGEMEEQKEESAERRRLTMLKDLQPYFLNVFAQFCLAGFNVVSKISLNEGMSRYVLVVYSHAIATLFTAVFLLFFERTNKAKINLRILRNIFFMSLLGPTFGRTLFYAGLAKTSSAFASAMGNLIPSMTFILAILCRMEKIEITKVTSHAKIAGTLVAAAGAALMTLYRGIVVISPPSRHSSHSAAPKLSLDMDWIKGSLMLTTSYLSLAGFYVLQTSTIKKYPAPISLTTLTCLMGTVEAAVMTLVLDHKASSWRLKWDISLLAPIYSGIIIYGTTTYIQTLVIRKKGPVFMTAFRPLCTIIVAIMGLFILAEVLHLGSIIGAIFVFGGLYITLWGKEKEKSSKPKEVEAKSKEKQLCDLGAKNEPPSIIEIKEQEAKM